MSTTTLFRRFVCTWHFHGMLYVLQRCDMCRMYASFGKCENLVTLCTARLVQTIRATFARKTRVSRPRVKRQRRLKRSKLCALNDGPDLWRIYRIQVLLSCLPSQRANTNMENWRWYINCYESAFRFNRGTMHTQTWTRVCSRCCWISRQKLELPRIVDAWPICDADMYLFTNRLSALPLLLLRTIE